MVGWLFVRDGPTDEGGAGGAGVTDFAVGVGDRFPDSPTETIDMTPLVVRNGRFCSTDWSTTTFRIGSGVVALAYALSSARVLLRE